MHVVLYCIVYPTNLLILPIHLLITRLLHLLFIFPTYIVHHIFPPFFLPLPSSPPYLPPSILLYSPPSLS